MLYASRYQTIHQVQGSTPIDLTGSTGAKFTWYCPFEKIEVQNVGAILTAASGAVSTPPIMTVSKIDLSATTTILRVDARITLAASMPAHSSVNVLLDKGLQKNSPIRGELDFPELVRGEAVVFTLGAAGVGGTQTIIPYILFREKEVDTK